jgi:hypothetical protein
MEIICGSKKYENLNLNKIVDYFDIVVRNNMNVGGDNYGSKPSTYQVLNNHVFNSYKNIQSLEKYKSFTDKITIDNFYNNVNNKNTKVLYFPNNNTNLMKTILKKNSIQLNVSKELRCGFGYMAHTLNKNNKPFLIGFSLNNKEYESHHINKKLSKVNDIGHDRHTELKIIENLHNNNLIDASFCTIMDISELTLDCSKLQPTMKSLSILLEVYGRISLKDYNENTCKEIIENFSKKQINKENESNISYISIVL